MHCVCFCIDHRVFWGGFWWAKGCIFKTDSHTTTTNPFDPFTISLVCQIVHNFLFIVFIKFHKADRTDPFCYYPLLSIPIVFTTVNEFHLGFVNKREMVKSTTNRQPSNTIYNTKPMAYHCHHIYTSPQRLIKCECTRMAWKCIAMMYYSRMLHRYVYVYNVIFTHCNK